MAKIITQNWESLAPKSIDVDQPFDTFNETFSDPDPVVSYYSETNTKLLGTYQASNVNFDLEVTGNHFTDNVNPIKFKSFKYSNLDMVIDITSNISGNIFTGKLSGFISTISYASSNGDSFTIEGKMNTNANGDIVNGFISTLSVETVDNTVEINGKLNLSRAGDIIGGRINSFTISDNNGHLLSAEKLSVPYKTFEKLTDTDNITDFTKLYNYITKSHDIFYGTLGADKMAGGLGNDQYIVNNVGDTVIENQGEGIDRVKSSISYTLTDHVEHLTLTDGSKNGGTANLDGTGNDRKNTIRGNAGDNTLDGISNVDKLYGGDGDDNYIVDLAQRGTNANNFRVKLEDLVFESKNRGDDTITLRGSFDHRKATTLTLKNHVEHMDASQTGTTKLNLKGNSLDNILTGNDADNKFIGRKGDDLMIGKNGDDTYIINSAGDSVTENVAEGIDTVKVSINAKNGEYTLGDNIEIGKLINNVNFNLIGNDEDNLLVGNAKANLLIGGDGDDWLDGGKGADIMVAGTGFGNFIVDNKNDVAIGGNTIVSSVSFDMSTNGQDAISLLLGKVKGNTIDGSGTKAIYTQLNINGIGNDLDNLITGTNGKNKIDGGIGNDNILGQGGNDKLTGGAGNDTFAFGAGDLYFVPRVEKFGKDIITDFNLAEDTLVFGAYQAAPNAENHYDFITSTNKGVTSTTLRVSLDGDFTNGIYNKTAEDGRVTLIGVDLFAEFGVATGNDNALYNAMFDNGNINSVIL